MRRLLPLAAPWWVFGACARYEWRPDVCALPPRTGGVVVADSTAAVRPGELAGALRSDRPDMQLFLPSVAVRPAVPGAAWVRVPVDTATRRFRVAGARPGRYEVRAAALAHAARLDTVSVPAAGRAVALVLAVAPLDGPCSGFAEVRVRKPWWKWW